MLARASFSETSCEMRGLGPAAQIQALSSRLPVSFKLPSRWSWCWVAADELVPPPPQSLPDFACWRQAHYSSNLPRQGSFSQVTNTTISLLIPADSLGFSDWSRPPPGSKALGDAGSARTMMRNGTQVLLSSPDPLPSLRRFSGDVLAHSPSLHLTQFSGKRWIRSGYGGPLALQKCEWIS